MKQPDPASLIPLKIKAARNRGAGRSMVPGGRFQALEDKLAQEKGVRNPAGLAAFIGRKAGKIPFGK